MPSALVLGGARCVHEDAEAALGLFTPDAIAAVNDIGIEWPGRLDYWVTLHANKTRQWPGIVEALHRRIGKGRNRPQIWGYKPHSGIDRHTDDWTGSSGLLTVKILIEEGFGCIVVAGVPMTQEGGHFYDTKAWLQCERYRVGWVKHHKEIAPFVRSMSGWTREQFGEPSDWFAS
jgi:hypothetical protein